MTVLDQMVAEWTLLTEMESELKKTARVLKCDIFEVATVVRVKLMRITALEKEVKRLKLLLKRRV